MSEAISGTICARVRPAYRCAHAGYVLIRKNDHLRAFTLSIALGTRPPSSRCSRCSNSQGDDDAKSDHDRGARRAYRRYGNPDLLRPERGRSRRRRNWRRCDRRVPRNLHGDRGERIEDGINERNGQRRRQHSGWREQRLESVGEPRACSSARHLARIRPRTAALGQAKSPGRSSGAFLLGFASGSGQRGQVADRVPVETRHDGAGERTRRIEDRPVH
jgi:hypothetical protein